MDNTKSKFEGQVIAQTNLEKRYRATPKAAYPGVFGAVRWLSWFAEHMPALGERARMVTILIVELSARSDHAFPSLRWLALHMGCSTGSVRLAIREAEQSGLVRRAERFDDRGFSGGRQTSNRYEIVLHPGQALRAELASLGDRELVIVDDEADPNQLELTVAREAAEPAREAPRPSLANVRPRAFATAPLPAQQREPRTPPLLDSIAPPSQPGEGVKELRENKEEKANSTHARASEPPRTSTAPAAAFFEEVLPKETAHTLKQRFGHAPFGSLLFAMRRNVCREHPALVKRAIERLCVASDVANPGGYFFRVFQAELEAATLAGPPSDEDLRREAEREQREALQRHARTLREKLDQAVGVDFDAVDRLHALRDQVLAQLRAPHTPVAVPMATPAMHMPLPRPTVSPAQRQSPIPNAPPPMTPEQADALAAAAAALAKLRGGATATREPLPTPAHAA